MIIEEPSKTYGKKDAYYFSHDSNARNDQKCLKLRRVLGLEGYGLFWILVEMLREAKDYRLPLDSITDIAFEARVSEEKIRAVITNFELFEIEQEHFFSLRLTRSMDRMHEKSLKYAKNANKRWGDAIALPLHSDCNALKERKGKEIKKKEIKLNESKAPAILEDELWLDSIQHQIKEKNLKEGWAECYAYHSQDPLSKSWADWQWKQKLLTWLSIKKTDNKTSIKPKWDLS